MKRNDKESANILDPSKPTSLTESGEPERPLLRRRKIDCGGSPEITGRRDTRGDAKRESERPSVG
jgi:hypothetical protein